MSLTKNQRLIAWIHYSNKGMIGFGILSLFMFGLLVSGFANNSFVVGLFLLSFLVVALCIPGIAAGYYMKYIGGKDQQ